jgi:hypothetical protein
MSTVLDQLMDAFVQAVKRTTQATGGVYEDRAQAYTVDEANAIDITLREAAGQPMGDYAVLRGAYATVVQIELAIYTRSAIGADGSEEPARKLANPIWQAAHAHLMTDPTFGGIASSTHWKRCNWRRENADGTAGWASHIYEVTLAMRMHNLQAPL